MSEQMDFNDGKYTVISDNGRLTALRNGEPWNRDITGDNLIYWMLVEAIRLKEERDASAAKLAELEGQEPVGYRHLHEDGWEYYDAPTGSGCSNCVPLYARPLSAMTVEQVLKQLNVMAEETFSKVKPAPEVPAEPVNARLLAAARAVVARWETPLWKDAPATAGFIYELRDAIESAVLRKNGIEVAE